jgi:hypothetical protein
VIAPPSQAAEEALVSGLGLYSRWVSLLVLLAAFAPVAGAAYSCPITAVSGVALSEPGSPFTLNVEAASALEPAFVAVAPTVIVAKGDDAPPERPRWPGIAALAGDRVVAVGTPTGDLISRLEPHPVDTVRFVADALHPDLFGAPRAAVLATESAL